MNKNIIKYIVDIGLVISFILVFLTGLAKFPQFYDYIRFIYNIIPRYTLSAVHDWSGLTMGALVLIHLILNFRWMICMTQNIFRREKKCDT